MRIRERPLCQGAALSVSECCEHALSCCLLQPPGRGARAAGRDAARQWRRGEDRVTTLCRDCGTVVAAAIRAERCGDCGSPRLVGHTALDTLAIAHIDCDAFYATVEKRDRPDLADRP